jgi:hypothetical protein
MMAMPRFRRVTRAPVAPEAADPEVDWPPVGEVNHAFEPQQGSADGDVERRGHQRVGRHRLGGEVGVGNREAAQEFQHVVVLAAEVGVGPCKRRTQLERKVVGPQADRFARGGRAAVEPDHLAARVEVQQFGDDVRGR